MNAITQPQSQLLSQPESSKLIQSVEIGALTEALVLFHTKCPAIPKDKKGTYGKYADLSTILEKVQPVLNECGLAVIQLPSGEFGLITILAHTSGEYIGSKYEMQPEERIIDKVTKERAITPQSIGAVITYQRRYALGAILSLNIDDDTDGEGPKEPEAPKKSAKEILAEKTAANAASSNATSADVKSNGSTITDPNPTIKETTTKLLNEGGGPTSQSTSEKCSEQTAEKIKKQLGQLEQSKPGVSADFKKRLLASGRSKITDFTVNEADALLASIEAKNIVAFFEKQLQTSA